MATLAEQLTEAQTKVAECMAAESQALQAQEIRLTSAGGMDRAEVMADLAQIRRQLVMWRGIQRGLEAQIAGKPTFAGMPFTSARFGDYTS